MVQTIEQILATGTIAAHIAIFVLVTLLLAERVKISGAAKSIRKSLTPYSYHLIFLATLTATLGSLFYSEVAKFQPCVLCWYQRIFMYPQPIIVYLAVVRNEFVLKPYLTALNLIGGVIAAYHYIIQLNPQLVIGNCSIKGGVDCIKGYHFYYGYISIPLMALTIFVFNLLILNFYSTKKHV